MKKLIAGLAILAIFIFSLVVACSPPAPSNIESVSSPPYHQILEGASGRDGDIKHTVIKAHAGTNNLVTVQDIKVALAFSPPPTATRPTTLQFTITRKYTGNPLQEFNIVHEKPLHLVLVREDLRYFAHLYPQHVAPGTFLVNYSFLAPGKYRLWADFTSRKQQYLVDFDLIVRGEGQAEPDSLGNVTVFLRGPGQASPNQDTRLQFFIYGQQRKPFTTNTPFLGAAAHLISIDNTLQEFSPNYDLDFNEDNILSFQHRFQKVGKHKLWVQFNAAGEARTAAFEVEVE